MWRFVFSLPWFVYLAVAPLLVVAGGYSFADTARHNAALDAAAAQPAPKPVAIENYRAARDSNSIGEVTLLAQIDLNNMIDVTRTKRGVERDHWVIAPLYPMNAKDRSAPAPGVLVQRGRLEDEAARRLIKGDGPIGPIVQLNGLMVDDFGDIRAIDTALDGKVKLAAEPIRIDPFEEGRAQGIANAHDPQIIAYLCFAAAVVALGFGLYRRQRTKAAAVSGDGGEASYI